MQGAAALTAGNLICLPVLMAPYVVRQKTCNGGLLLTGNEIFTTAMV